MNEDRVDRIRYNINIQHSRAGAGNGLTSPAIFSESLARPLINNPSEWDVLINKFKIDTFTIPITIVKLKEYQTRKTTEFETDYDVQLVYKDYVYSAQVMYKPEPNTNPSVKVVETREDGMVKYDNTDEAFFVYSYQQILDMINEAIEKVCADAYIESAPFLLYDTRTQLISAQYSSDFDQLSIEETPILSFSHNLEEFVGKGFRCLRFGHDRFYHKLESDTYQAAPFYLSQEYPTVGNWNICNAILITSSSLPVQPEYYPIHTADGELVHHHTGGSEYLNMGSLQILAVYYPNASKAGDMSTSVYYSSDNIANGDRISLRGSTPINRMDIQIYWADVYNNLYQLKLPENGQASIRLVFIRK